MRGVREGDPLLNDNRDFRCWPSQIGETPDARPATGRGSVVDRAAPAHYVSPSLMGTPYCYRFLPFEFATNCRDHLVFDG